VGGNRRLGSTRGDESLVDFLSNGLCMGAVTLTYIGNSDSKTSPSFNLSFGEQEQASSHLEGSIKNDHVRCFSASLALYLDDCQ
jgi:hypothetical protein